MGPLGTVDLARRAMYRSSPTEGSAVVLEAKVGGQYGGMRKRRMGHLLGCHMNRRIFVFRNVVTGRRMRYS